MSPWIDDPDTGTSHYEKPKRRTNREYQREAEQAAGREAESFGAKMARLKAEKKQAQADAAEVVRRLESLEVQGS
jgi:protein-disulfide isomerase-like protein with CxxC motif